MNKSLRRGIGVGMACLGLTLAGLPAVRAAEVPELAVTGLVGPVEAGASPCFWLTAFNASDAAVDWTFPPRVVCRLSWGAASLEVLADQVGASPGTRLQIAPGTFARAQYRLTWPERLTGPVRMEFTGLPVAGLALEAQPALAKAGPTKPASSTWERLLRDAEPSQAGTTFTPARFFKEHFFPYDPFYFIAGTESPNAKFQISFRYRLLNEEGWLASRAPALTGLHLAYTQTSLWDWNAESKPFYDSSYKPEVLYALEQVLGGRAQDWFQLDLQGGLQHESNGRAGAESRSLNIAYLRPRLVLGRRDSLQLTLLPRLWTYVGGLDDNPNLDDYRGYGDLRVVLGWQRGLQVSALGRLGDDADHGSLQLDVTYPMMRLLKGSFSLYLHAQYFTGYGESLLGYRERSDIFRVGMSLYR